ncbi:signal peptidase I [Clostridium sp.]|uniref:signal peptidase I n=1 Tax=Clostridium sp. TaxID=1506 RepID=UPI003D6CA9A7
MFINEKRVLKLMAIIIFFQLAYILFSNSNIQIHAIIRPLITTLFWLATAIYIWFLDRPRGKSKLRFHSFITLWVFISACLYIFTYFAFGFIEGFAKTPYDTTAVGILKSLLLYGSVIIFKEWVRSFIINSVQKRFALILGVGLVFVYTFISVNWNPLFRIESFKDYITFFSSKVFVVLALNIFLTYIAYLSGAFATTIYVLVSQVPLWFMSPIPNLTWFTISVIGIVFPMFSLYVIINTYNKQVRITKTREYRENNPYSWVLIAIFSVLLVWFSVGVFPISPSLVLTESMQPEINPGDVIIAKKIDTQYVKLGDVVKYWNGNYYIVHRIVDIYVRDGQKYYITKGDANEFADAPVLPEQVKGVVIYTIHKIGRIPLWIKKQISGV